MPPRQLPTVARQDLKFFYLKTYWSPQFTRKWQSSLFLKMLSDEAVTISFATNDSNPVTSCHGQVRCVVSQILLQRLGVDFLAVSLNKSATSWQLPRLPGSYGETCVMDFGHNPAWQKNDGTDGHDPRTKKVNGATNCPSMRTEINIYASSYLSNHFVYICNALEWLTAHAAYPTHFTLKTPRRRYGSV